MNGKPWYFLPNPFGLFHPAPIQPVEPTPQPIEPIPIEPTPQSGDKWTVWKTAIDQFCRFPADKPAPYFGLTFYQTGLLSDKLVYPNGDVTTIEGVGLCVEGTIIPEPTPISQPTPTTNIDDICKCIQDLKNALNKIGNNSVKFQPTGDFAYITNQENDDSGFVSLWGEIGGGIKDTLAGQTLVDYTKQQIANNLVNSDIGG
jgi:hypothetical protein